MKAYRFVPGIVDLDSDWFNLESTADAEWIHEASSLKDAMVRLSDRLKRDNPESKVIIQRDCVTMTTASLTTGMHRYLFTYAFSRIGSAY
jgi:hypothetical protein